MKVLIVDDEAINRQILREAFEANGDHEIFEANNGREGLDAYTKHMPHVTITDWDMPFTDGVTMIWNIKKAVIGAKIIFVTGSGLPVNLPQDVVRVQKPYRGAAIVELAMHLVTSTSAPARASLQGKTKHPSWTVWAQKEIGRWVARQWYFFDDEDAARKQYDQLNQMGWVATLRRWNLTVDAQHMHILDQEAMK
jgi:two-component system chemotaxis response regulator CheY